MLICTNYVSEGVIKISITLSSVIFGKSFTKWRVDAKIWDVGQFEKSGYKNWKINIKKWTSGWILNTQIWKYKFYDCK